MKDFLEEKYRQYNSPEFIQSDPVSIPHLFSKKEDREIAGFLAATIAWGQRPTILRNARKLMQWMDDDPHRFILHFTDDDLNPFRKFVHRTFHGDDCIYFLQALRHIYKNHNGLESAFATGMAPADKDLKNGIANCRKLFFELPHLKRTEKHFSNPDEGSACKRINMTLSAALLAACIANLVLVCAWF